MCDNSCKFLKQVLKAIEYTVYCASGFTSGTSAQPKFMSNKMSDAYDKAGDMPGNRLDKMRKGDPAEYMNAVHPNNHSRYVYFRVCARTEQDLRHWAPINYDTV